MNILIDMLGISLIVFNVWLGFRYGLVRRLVGLGGLYAGILVATFAGNAIAGWFNSGGQPSSLYADAWAFVLIVAVVTAGIEILGALYSDRLRAIISLMFDRTTAAVAGAGLGFLQIAVICLVAVGTGTAHDPNTQSPLPANRGSVSDSVRSSIIGGRVNGLIPQLNRVFRPVMPDDLAAHLAEPARVDTPTLAGH